jgi:hypothetical protein
LRRRFHGFGGDGFSIGTDAGGGSRRIEAERPQADAFTATAAFQRPSRGSQFPGNGFQFPRFPFP